MKTLIRSLVLRHAFIIPVILLIPAILAALFATGRQRAPRKPPTILGIWHETPEDVAASIARFRANREARLREAQLRGDQDDVKAQKEAASLISYKRESGSREFFPDGTGVERVGSVIQVRGHEPHTYSFGFTWSLSEDRKRLLVASVESEDGKWLLAASVAAQEYPSRTTVFDVHMTETTLTLTATDADGSRWESHYVRRAGGAP
jgi:hypothetical protein